MRARVDDARSARRTTTGCLNPHTGTAANVEYSISRALHPLFLALPWLINASTVLRQSFPAWEVLKSFDQVGVPNVKD